MKRIPGMVVGTFLFLGLAASLGFLYRMVKFYDQKLNSTLHVVQSMGTYTLQASDAGKVIVMNCESDCTVILPPYAFPPISLTSVGAGNVVIRIPYEVKK